MLNFFLNGFDNRITSSVTRLMQILLFLLSVCFLLMAEHIRWDAYYICQTYNRLLISRILVGEVKKIDGEKFQEIKIIYNFVGEIPAVTE